MPKTASPCVTPGVVSVGGQRKRDPPGSLFLVRESTGPIEGDIR